MGMSTHIRGFKPPDEKWRKMKEVYDTCNAAGVEPPSEVWEFFNDEVPDPAGVEVMIPYREYSDSDTLSEGYEIDVKALPPDVTVIRVWNSW